MKYTVVQGFSLYEIADEVNTLVGRGYEPCGGVSAVWGPCGTIFFQAMVRR